MLQQRVTIVAIIATIGLLVTSCASIDGERERASGLGYNCVETVPPKHNHVARMVTCSSLEQGQGQMLIVQFDSERDRKSGQFGYETQDKHSSSYGPMLVVGDNETDVTYVANR